MSDSYVKESDISMEGIMNGNVDNFYNVILNDNNFSPIKVPTCFPPYGKCWYVDSHKAQGYFWIYDSGKGYNIKIHDFTFKQDMMVSFDVPDCLSITWYESISGKEFNPYRELKSHIVKSFLGGKNTFRCFVNKEVPICCVGIEYEPAYYKNYLSSHFNDNNLEDIFKNIDETSEFNSMRQLLLEIQNYRGTGLEAEIYYDVKTSLALSLIYQRYKDINNTENNSLPKEDIKIMYSLKDYIDTHYKKNLTTNYLAKKCCMGTTKFKKCFKLFFKCTLNEYITTTRIKNAEELLLKTDMQINEIADSTGFSNAGYFAKIFEKQKGMLPTEYRKLSNRYDK